MVGTWPKNMAGQVELKVAILKIDRVCNACAVVRQRYWLLVDPDFIQDAAFRAFYAVSRLCGCIRFIRLVTHGIIMQLLSKFLIL